MSQNCRSRAPHWRALPSRTRAPNPPFRRVGRDRAFGAAWPDGGLWRKRARPGIMRAQLCERRAGVTRLPKKFGSLPYRFVALVALVVWAPLAAVVGATGGALLAVVCGVLVALYAVLVMWRVGIVATADGVRLRGYVRNRHIHWQDVDRFEDEDTDRYRPYVVLVSGERVKITGIGPSRGFREHTTLLARRHLAALNAIRSQLSSGQHLGE